MKILSLDTATNHCSVAISEGSKILIEINFGIKQTHSKHLMELIHKAFDLTSLTIDEIEAFAVNAGPGSFTGVRIGINTIKGFAMALNKPVVPISSLDILAFQGQLPYLLICPMVDARKKEVYYALYQYQQQNLKKILEPKAAHPDKIVEKIDQQCVFIGDGALLYQKIIKDKLGENAIFLPHRSNILRASTLSILANFELEDNHGIKADKLLPFYVRKPDAKVPNKPTSLTE